MASTTKNGSPASPWAGRVQYESELDPGFPEMIAKVPGAENLLGCIQCGTCAGSCPVSPYMDLTPREIIAMTRAGFRREVLGSRTIWLCASCYACTVACPKQIRITDVMYALKRQAMREGRHPKRFPVSVLAREFFEQVRRYGRNSEGQLIVRLYAKTNPLGALKNMLLGLRLFLRGRIDLKAEAVRDRASVQALLAGTGQRATKKEAAA